MSTLLHIQCSPRIERSKSREVAEIFLKSYSEHHPDDKISTLDIWSSDLPDMTENVLNAKYRILHGEEMSDKETESWNEVVNIINEFKQSGKLLISIPMWNFGIPYKLKHYIDIITQPGYTFSVDPQTGEYSGLMENRPVCVVYARGGAYTEDLSFLDYQASYIKLWLGFIGLTDINSITVEPTIADPSSVSKGRDRAIEQAIDMGRNF